MFAPESRRPRALNKVRIILLILARYCRAAGTSSESRSSSGGPSVAAGHRRAAGTSSESRSSSGGPSVAAGHRRAAGTSNESRSSSGGPSSGGGPLTNSGYIERRPVIRWRAIDGQRAHRTKAGHQAATGPSMGSSCNQRQPVIKRLAQRDHSVRTAIQVISRAAGVRVQAVLVPDVAYPRAVAWNER